MKLTPENVWQMEETLSRPLFRGVPIGAALASLWHIEVYTGNADTSFGQSLRNRVRRYYRYCRPINSPATDVSFCRGRVLVTCFAADFRCRDLVFPVVKHLGYDRCAVLYADAKVAAFLPAAARGIAVANIMCYDTAAWRRDFGRFWRELKPSIKRVIRQYGLPPRLYPRLADAVLVCTQQVSGLLEFLRGAEPAAVLTEYDRNGIWAPLVLSARALGIPTYTLVHGTQGERCNGFYPLLADAVFCWGKTDQDKFLAAGVAPERTLVGGCPRLTRELAISSAAARTKMGLDPGKPVVTFGTVPYRQHRMKLAGDFCRAAKEQDVFQTVVRLHPVEKLAEYAPLAAEFPNVRFTSSSQYTLDEVLAGADIVVVHSSGLGSDALVKRRLTVVLDTIDFPLGHGRDLADLAGCPRARSVDELRSLLLRTLGDVEYRGRLERCRETFVASFCAFFGEAAAQRIADHVLANLPTRQCKNAEEGYLRPKTDQSPTERDRVQT